jgi:hypothetical protein
MAEPLTPPPDEKDWTWVLERPCPQCRFDAAAVKPEAYPRFVKQYTGQLGDAVASHGAAGRPQPDVWSALEYGCHVRDVCRIFAGRLERMLTEDDPRFANWDQDETARVERYWAQSPAVVGPELAAAAADLVAVIDGIGDGQWQRPGRRSNGSVFTVDTLIRYLLHDLAHHVWDVTTGQPW